MSEQEIEAWIVSLLRETRAELVEVEISAEMSFEDLGLDSLTRIDVLAAAEVEFEMEVPDGEVANIVTVRDLVGFISAVRVG